MKDVILKIKGMSCMHCVSRVQKTLARFDGVRNIDVKIGEAKFSAPDTFDVSKVIAAVEEEGYTVQTA